MLAWDAAWLVDLAGVMWGVAEVRAVAPTVAILTFGEWFAVFDIVVVGATLCAEEGVMLGAVSPEVIEIVIGMVDLVVGHVGKGGHAVDDPRGDAVVGVGVCEGFDAFEALFCDVFKVHS